MSPDRSRRTTLDIRSSSVRPSGVPNIDLPYGPPHKALTELQKNQPLSADLRRRIRALSNNANRIRTRAPLMSAQCWHEAGRLLDRHGEQYAEAWVCYSRALAVFPDFKIALTALLRLARAAGDTECTSRLLDAASERAVDPYEKAALLSESAVILLKSGDARGAFGKLLNARSVAPSALVPKLLLTLVSSTVETDLPRSAILTELAEHLPEDRLARPLRLAAYQLEVSEGRDSTIPKDPTRSDLSTAWIYLRYCLKRGAHRDAVRALSRMIDDATDTVLRKTLLRLKVTLSMLEGNHTTVPEPLMPDPMHRFLGALSKDGIIREQAVVALRSAAAAATSRDLAAAFSLMETLFSMRMNEHNLFPRSAPGIPDAFHDAAVSFIKMGSTSRIGNAKLAAAALDRALAQKNWPQIATQLLVFSKKTSDDAVRWPLFVTRLAVQLEHIGNETIVNHLINDDTETPFKAPLPAILRRLSTHPRAFAKIAVREAEAVRTPKAKALLLSWAAHHLEPTDPFEAARLYTEALAVDPSSCFAIAGLKRTGTDTAELATLYLEAATRGETGTARASAKARAAIAFYQIGDHEQAGQLMCEAANHLPEERALAYAGLSLVLNRAAEPPESAVKLLERNALLRPLFAHIGPLALFCAPNAAAQCFDTAATSDPADPIIDRGLTEAHFRAGHPTAISQRLLQRLRQADGIEEKAKIYQRLAHLDRFLIQDPSAAVLSAHALSELLPGHRPTLVQLLVYYADRGRKNDLCRVMTSLALSVTDTRDATAMARLTTLHDPVRIDLLRHVVSLKEATLLELTSMEGRAIDTDEQQALLERIIDRLPKLRIYPSRLADVLGRAKAYEAAISLYRQSMENPLLVIYNLHAMVGQLRALQNHTLLLDTLVIQSDYYEQATLKADVLIFAAKMARDVMASPERAVSLCMVALTVNPTSTEAFEMAEQLLTEVVTDPVTYITLMETRLTGATSPLERLVLHLKLKDLLGRFDDNTSSEKCRAHQNEAIALIINAYPGFDDALSPEEQKKQAEAWLEAVDRAIETQRLEHRPQDDVALYAAIGDNMLTFLDDDIRAEHYLDKALALDRNNPTALAFLADIRLKSDDAPEAARLLEQLFETVDDPRKKRQAALRLADLFLDHLNDEELADRYLSWAIQLDPLDLAPLKKLIELCEKQGDDFTASVHLDSALARHCQAVQTEPKNLALYDGVRFIAEQKSETLLSSLAQDLLDLNARSDATPRAVWTFHPLAADPGIDPYLVPESISPALRASIEALFVPVVTLEKLDSASDNADKLKRRAPLQVAFNTLAPHFGLRDAVAKVGDVDRIRTLPGPPVTIIFPRRFLDAAASTQQYAVAYALEMLHIGLGLTTLVSEEALRGWLAGLMRLLDQKYRHPTTTEHDLTARADRLAGLVSKETMTALRPHRTLVGTVFKAEDLFSKLTVPGHRVGFFAAGSLAAALQGFLAVEACVDTPPLDAPGIGMLLSFIFSRDHLLIRKRLGA